MELFYFEKKNRVLAHSAPLTDTRVRCLFNKSDCTTFSDTKLPSDPGSIKARVSILAPLADSSTTTAVASRAGLSGPSGAAGSFVPMCAAWTFTVHVIPLLFLPACLLSLRPAIVCSRV